MAPQANFSGHDKAEPLTARASRRTKPLRGGGVREKCTRDEADGVRANPSPGNTARSIASTGVCEPVTAPSHTINSAKPTAPP